MVVSLFFLNYRFNLMMMCLLLFGLFNLLFNNINILFCLVLLFVNLIISWILWLFLCLVDVKSNIFDILVNGLNRVLSGDLMG